MTPSEKALFELLTHVPSGSSEDDRIRRIKGLEELQRRIQSDSIEDKGTAASILLNMAKTQGTNQPESLLIINSLTLFINKEVLSSLRRIHVPVKNRRILLSKG